jgi:hypothetical protein
MYEERESACQILRWSVRMLHGNGAKEKARTSLSLSAQIGASDASRFSRPLPSLPKFDSERPFSFHTSWENSMVTHSIASFAVAIVSAISVADDDAAKAELKKLDGTWQLVSAMKDGKETPRRSSRMSAW